MLAFSMVGSKAVLKALKRAEQWVVWLVALSVVLTVDMLGSQTVVKLVVLRADRSADR